MVFIMNSKSVKYIIANIHGKSNYHTHTFYCDGKDSPEDMVLSAIDLGFSNLGFSGHQFSVQDADYAMSPENEVKYRADVRALQEKYGDKINVFLGIERDSCCEATEGFQYVIGSTHHIENDNTWLNIDESPHVMEDAVKEHFDGDYMAYAEAYYDFESQVLIRTRGQIVGHFDLVAVFNEGNKYFDERDSAYRKWAIRSAERLVECYVKDKDLRVLPDGFPEELGEVIYKTGMPIFEINTGAMAKGRRSVPYPAPFIIEHLAEMGVPFVINSDCHDRNYLNFGFSGIIDIFK